jgi:hypothetical protein
VKSITILAEELDKTFYWPTINKVNNIVETGINFAAERTKLNEQLDQLAKALVRPQPPQPVARSALDELLGNYQVDVPRHMM